MGEERFVVETVVSSVRWSSGIFYDPYAVAVVHCDEAEVVGHIPRKISYLCYFFIKRKGTIICQVTGKRRRSVDLPQGDLEVPFTLTFSGNSTEIRKVKTLFDKAQAANIEPPAKKAKTDEKADVISSSNSEDDDGFEDEVWQQYHGCLLTEYDKITFESNDFLSDLHINYAQILLNHQFPSAQGLRNTLFQDKELRKIEQGIQIIHDRKTIGSLLLRLVLTTQYMSMIQSFELR